VEGFECGEDRVHVSQRKQCHIFNRGGRGARNTVLIGRGKKGSDQQGKKDGGIHIHKPPKRAEAVTNPYFRKCKGGRGGGGLRASDLEKRN